MVLLALLASTVPSHTAAAAENVLYVQSMSGACCVGAGGTDPVIADDFEVPPGTTWMISAISTPQNDDESRNIVFYLHDTLTNAPGGIIAKFVNVPTTYTDVTGQNYQSIGTYHLPEAMILPAGHYWVGKSLNGPAVAGLDAMLASPTYGAPAKERDSQHGWKNSADANDMAYTLYGMADTTPPVVTCSATPTFHLNQANAIVSATVSDPESGVVTAKISKTVSTQQVGSQTIWLSGTNGARMSTTVQCPFNVAYKFSGLLDEFADTRTKSAQAGQLISFRWRLTDANNVPITDPASVTVADVITSMACRTAGTPTSVYSGTAGLTYLGDGYWRYNWQTSSAYAGECHTLKLSFNDRLTSAQVPFIFNR